MKRRPIQRVPELAPQPVHRLPPALLQRAVRVVVVGCGGTGSEIASGLPFLHQAMIAHGHPGGLDVVLVDGDIVSETNTVRQAFSAADIGHPKATISSSLMRFRSATPLDRKASAAELA